MRGGLLNRQKIGNFIPLIDEMTFNKVQDILKGKKTALVPHKKNNPDFPLRNFVRCGACNRPLTASWSKGRSKRYPNYRCQNKTCKSVSIRSEKIEGFFIDYLNKYKPKAGEMALLQATLRMVWEEKLGKAGAESAHLITELNGLKEQVRLLDDAFLYKKVIKRKSTTRSLSALKQSSRRLNRP